MVTISIGKPYDFVKLAPFVNKDEVRLLLEPVEVLTPLLLEDLHRVAEKHSIGLFFDTYEHTCEYLDDWLRDVFNGRYGTVPANTVFCIAGRDELDKNRWGAYEGLLARILLEPFTEEEARNYLTRKGITDKRVVETILHLSGCLPLLIATLAVESPSTPDQVDDPSDTAVERFLKWVEDPARRQVALDAALPHSLNRDVLAVLVQGEDTNALFEWLRKMPFVVERADDGWTYHEVVRTQMLRHKRRESPQSWTDQHEKLADYYERGRDNLGLDEETGIRNPTWQAYTLNALYHRLCQAPKHLPILPLK